MIERVRMQRIDPPRRPERAMAAMAFAMRFPHSQQHRHAGAPLPDGVSETALSLARRILRERPDLAAEVAAGRASLYRAFYSLARTPSKRRA